MYQLKRRHLGALVLTVLAGLMVTSLAGPASAQSSGDMRLSRTPLIAVVSIRSQRVVVYAGHGKILESPVSTGQSGYETPVGIFSIIQRARDHYSNLYNNAPMPFMQRLTWSGIALHSGDLPGYPASHGCIRMPHGFAARLYGLSKRGMRVLVVRDDMSPVDFDHHALFKPGPAQPVPANDQAPSNLVLSSTRAGDQQDAAAAPPQSWRSIAMAKEAAAEITAKKADEARRAADKLIDAAAEVEEELELAEDAKARAEARIESATERLLEVEESSAFAQKLRDSKIKAQERLIAAQARIDAIDAAGKAKIAVAVAARREAKAARLANFAAQSEAKAAGAQMAPISVFISRKTQRLYVRQAFEPLFESDVTIHNARAPIGTTLFTAMHYTDGGADLRWNALTMYPSAGAHGSQRNRDGEPTRTSADAAKAALERITIPQDTVDRINELISPGSSLIISDEGMSRETSKGTDFVVLMSGEPQGGSRRRRPAPNIARDYEAPFSPATVFNPFYW